MAMSLGNTILMVELEKKFLNTGGWFPSAHNFRNASYFHKIFSTHLYKGSVYLYTKQFLSQLLHF